MSTWDKTKDRRELVRWTAVSALTALFAAVYESMSHGVVSYYMVFAFAVPLLLGAGRSALRLARKAEAPGARSAALWDLGVGTLLTGSLVQGALAIYGTANHLTAVYPAAGVALLFMSLLLSRFGT